MKKIVIFILTAIITVSMFSIPTSASYSYYNSYNFSKGALFWKKNYTVKVYRDPNWMNIYHGTASTSTGFEYKGNTEIVLSQTRSFNVGKETIWTLNSNLEAESYGIKAGVGGSVSASSAASWGVANATARTIEKSAPKGYYSYNVCLNLYKIKLKKYQDGSHKGTLEFFAPKDQEPYRAIVYNKNAASYSGASLY